jgi:hypothetical protein
MIYASGKIMSMILSKSIRFIDTRQNPMNMGLTHIYEVTVTRYLNETDAHRRSMTPADHTSWLRSVIEKDALDIDNAVKVMRHEDQEIEIEASL